MFIDTSKNSSFSTQLGERLGHFDTTNDLFSSHFDFKSLLFENDFKAIFPELFLITVTLSLLLYGVILSTSSKYPLLVGNLTFLSLLALLFVPLLTQNNPLQHGFIFYNTLYIDSTTLFTKSIVCWAAFFSSLISINYLKLEGLNGFEFVILVLLSLSSMLFLIMSADFLSMYLGIEFQSLCFYVMAALKRDSEFSTEAGLKYFLLGAFSSALLLFGITLIYGFTGTTSFSDLSKLFSVLSNPSVVDTFHSSVESFSSNKEHTEHTLGILSTIGYNEKVDLGFGLHNHSTCLLGMVLITVGFLFKLTAFPFHMWAPDVYEGAPTPVTAFFSIVPKVAVLTVFVNLYLIGFYDLSVSWQKILVFSSLGSMILGSLAAMSQNKIKRLLAYSSIGHVGYLLIGLCSSTVEGIQALFIYLFIYLVMTINIFCIVLLPVKRISRNRNTTETFYRFSLSSPTQSSLSSSPQTLIKENRDVSVEKGSLYKANPSPKNENPGQGDLYLGSDRIKYTTDLAFMANSHPLIALNLTLTMFSIAGIPPLAGFYSKAYLFFAALSSSQFLLAVVGVLTSVVSCFYYIRIVQIMYFVVPRTWLTFTQISKESAFTLAICFFFILLFVIYPFPLYLVAHKVALTLSY